MTNAILETRNITKRFGALVASEDISIDLMPGEIHAVIGPNGAGKSTLIAQICGTLKPDAGSIHLLSRDITTENSRTRASAGLGRTFQVSALAMEDSVLQNTVLGVLGASGNPWRFWKPALKSEGTKDLTKLLDELRHEAPILLVEHDMDAVFALADRISVLVYGKIIATGTVDEIRTNKQVRQAYLGEEA